MKCNVLAVSFFSALPVWAFPIIGVVLVAAIVCLIILLKRYNSRKKLRRFFDEHIKKVERDESLDKAIEIKINNGIRERIFIRVIESSQVISREHLHELKDKLSIGSSFSGNDIFLNDDRIDKTQCRLVLVGQSVCVTALSSVYPTVVLKRRFAGRKKHFVVPVNEAVELRTDDIILIGNTSLTFIAYSNIRGLI